MRNHKADSSNFALTIDNSRWLYFCAKVYAIVYPVSRSLLFILQVTEAPLSFIKTAAEQ